MCPTRGTGKTHILYFLGSVCLSRLSSDTCSSSPSSLKLASPLHICCVNESTHYVYIRPSPCDRKNARQSFPRTNLDQGLVEEPREVDVVGHLSFGSDEVFDAVSQRLAQGPTAGEAVLLPLSVQRVKLIPAGHKNSLYSTIGKSPPPSSRIVILSGLSTQTTEFSSTRQNHVRHSYPSH